MLLIVSSLSEKRQLGVMPVSNVHWRAETGVFNARLNAKYLKPKYHNSICFSGIYVGDIEVKRGPKKRDSYLNLSLCHLNLNSIAAHNLSKLKKLVEAYNPKHNFDIICLSETNLDSSIQHDYERLPLNRYNLARANNPDNNRGGAGIYFKQFLAIRRVKLNNLNE